MKKAVAFTGPSNSGKTTLIVKICEILSPVLRVAVVKNDPKDKARFDVEGKDSYKFFASGADVAVVSPTRTTLFSHFPRTVDEILPMFGRADVLLVEGLKHLPLPRIAVFRGAIDESYLPVVQALAVDDTVDVSGVPPHIDILDLNDPRMVIAWIEHHGKDIQTS